MSKFSVLGSSPSGFKHPNERNKTKATRLFGLKTHDDALLECIQQSLDSQYNKKISRSSFLQPPQFGLAGLNKQYLLISKELNTLPLVLPPLTRKAWKCPGYAQSQQVLETVYFFVC